ncbi:MAG: hypothetical protein RIE59_14825 [Imperialibacter sp.]
MNVRLAFLTPWLLLNAVKVMSQAHDDTVTTEELVSQSDLIVIVRRAEPFTSVVKKRTSLWLWKPPFEVIYHHYVIEKVLFRSSREEVPEVAAVNLKVRMADYSRKRTVHKLYYNKGIRKIPIYRHYEGGIKPTEAALLIVFCQYKPEEKVFEYTVQGACESVEMEKTILSFLAK